MTDPARKLDRLEKQLDRVERDEHSDADDPEFRAIIDDKLRGLLDYCVHDRRGDVGPIVRLLRDGVTDLNHLLTIAPENADVLRSVARTAEVEWLANTTEQEHQKLH
jgi:hypothetical protein